MNGKSLVTTYSTTVEENIQLLRDYYASYRAGQEAKQKAHALVLTLLQIGVRPYKISSAMGVNQSEINRIYNRAVKNGQIQEGGERL